MNSIDVVVLSWPNHPRRLEYFHRTLAALQKNLSASRHMLRWQVACESERDPESTWHGDELQSICDAAKIPVHWRAGPASLGAGMNFALRCCEGPLIALCQDDYELIRPLDLSPGADALLASDVWSMIRYSYYIHPENGTRFIGPSPWQGFRIVDPSGPWCYGDDPHLRHIRMMERHGWYKEGIGHASEGDMVYRLAREKAAILAADQCYFGHFGQVAAVPKSKEYRERAVER